MGGGILLIGVVVIVVVVVVVGDSGKAVSTKSDCANFLGGGVGGAATAATVGYKGLEMGCGTVGSGLGTVGSGLGVVAANKLLGNVNLMVSCVEALANM